MPKYTSRSRSELDVGITCRLGSHPRIHALVKERFSDFHVHEIGPDGSIIKLTSLSPPVDNSVKEGVNDAEILTLVEEDIRGKVDEFQKRLQSADKKALRANGGALGKESILIKVTDLDKESRTRIHRWISSFDKLSSETVDSGGVGDNDKFIKIVPMTKNNRLKRRPASRAKYTHCVLYKEGVETSEAIGFIAQQLHLNPSLISYAGIKDKQAKTSQRIAICNIEASRLAGICKFKQGIKLGNFEYHPHPIPLGQLKGNHFKLLLKNLRLEEQESSSDKESTLEQIVTRVVTSLSTLGFINYYGMQRFGSYEVSTHHVGLELLKQNWIKAFDLILGVKPNDRPWMVEAKNLWLKQRKPAEACKALQYRRSIESHLLHGLALSYAKNDFVAVFTKLPRNQRLLYIHAYQSFLWNRVASYRIQEYGMRPTQGDLVAVDRTNSDEDVGVAELELGIDDDNVDIVKEDSAPLIFSSKLEVKHLSEEDLESGKYSILDVLIPLFGIDVKYPQNKTKEFLDGILKDDGIDDECVSKFRPISDKPIGGYRKLVVLPNHVSHEIRTYSDSESLDHFIPSDWDVFQDVGTKTNQYSKDGDNQTDPPNDAVKKDKSCMIVEFSLPSSSYATMALREILVEEKSCPKNQKDETVLSKEISTLSSTADTEIASEEEPLSKKQKTE